MTHRPSTGTKDSCMESLQCKQYKFIPLSKVFGQINTEKIMNIM